MTKKKKRVLSLIIGAISVGFGAWLILTSLEDNLLYFHSPSDILVKKIDVTKEMRLGGMVKKASIRKDGIKTIFIITDFKHDIETEYSGILPALFREEQGVIAEGHLVHDRFIAKRILAKHDENYMPPEVKKALEN